MKVFAAIFLSFAVFIQTFSTFIIRADFYLNQSYIAKNLCVNKDNPMMHCNGKCYLSKKLKQQQQGQTPASRTEKFDAQPFFVPKVFSLKNTYTVLQHHYFIQDENSISSFPRFIFHPPTV